MSFTPGPWFTTGTMTKYVEAKIGGGLVQEIAAVGPTAADNGYGAQQEGNARLIAAAPELLEALELILRKYEAQADYAELDTDGAAVAAARAVIAKARAES